jgi:hypothetical protein
MSQSWIRVGAVYLALALFLCFPAPFSGELIGNPDIDVWNHAWGYFYWLDHLSKGLLPWSTELIYGPEGGVLYFVDPLGALASLPFSALFGVGFAYNLVQISRFAFAGLVSHFLCKEVTGEGPHCWAAGVAYASTPYLLAEQGNGISEVGAVGWIPLVLWMAVRAFKSNARRDWVLLGLAQGLCSVASFYYGLTSALLVGGWWLCSFQKTRMKGSLLAGGLAALIAVPVFALFRASLWPGNARGVIRRSADLNAQLLAHNAVDPREYVIPGSFQSVDFLEVYGEAFVHTAYLRWSALLLAGWACWKVGRATRPWVWMALGSLVLGLGRVLWWDGGFVGPGERHVLLPFGWLQEVLPQLAITHSSRLSIGAQAIVPLLVGWALVGQSRRIIGGVCALLLAESLLFSSAQWPLPMASSEIPSVYERIGGTSDTRGVLDLPPEVGTTMASSQYFWFQTRHGKPIPYGPDARSESSADAVFFRWLLRGIWSPESSQNTNPGLDTEAQIRAHLKRRYGWIVLHENLADRAGYKVLIRRKLRALLGPPQREEGLIFWAL